VRPLLEPAEGDDPWPTMKVVGWIIETSAPHEEGSSSDTYTICRADCRIGERSQRDYFAEAMGY
jgi:hypothetical protein